MSNGKLTADSILIGNSRYFAEGEDWEKCTTRVAKANAEAEINKSEYVDRFGEMIFDLDFIPGGRILRNSGRSRGSLFNCYHLPCGDSIEEIGQFLKDTLILWSEGGGIGCNFSTLRPKGEKIFGKGGESSGLVSFIKASDAIAQTVEIGGSRRAAGLASIDVTHPEVLDFIDAKTVNGILSHYNISVGITNDFLKAVEREDDWDFKFNQRKYGSMPAIDIWNKILENTIKYAEPGILNMSNITKNNSYYYDPVRGTNPLINHGALYSNI